jgi:uncharacterized protein YdeI (YjbR/CyaY-like superfamily)
MKAFATVNEYISGTGEWMESLNLLRDLFLSAGLDETVKWGGPVYTFEGKNIAGMAAFKSYAGIWFFQGALLKDKQKKLVNAQEGVTKALRQWRFGSADEVDRESKLIIEYIKEAIAHQKQGRQIKPDKNKPLILPEELKQVLDNNAGLKQRFDALSLSKKRDYVEYIGEARQMETKQKRLDKIIPMILEGKGLNDKYLK